MDIANLSELPACIDQRWSPAIGDPTFMGWTTFVCYFIASFASFVAGRVRRQDKRIWIMLTVFLLLLGVNKQLDLQSALTATGRCVAQFQGWYGQRRTVQFAFVLALLCVSTLVMALAFYRLRQSLRRAGLALLGFGFLVTFVAVRAVGFQHFDQFIGGDINLGLRTKWLMELTGIGLILINAIAAIKSSNRIRRPSEAAGLH